MKHLYIIITVLAASLLISCDHDGWLERDPKDTITDEQLWNDPSLIKSLLANYYNRLPQLHGDFNIGGMSEIDDAMWSGHNDGNGKNDFQYGNSYGRYWDYELIRDINLSLDNIEEYSVKLDEATKKLFVAELRFIRTFIYFDLVKRMGGVPLVTEQLIYDFSGDPSYLQIPRSSEEATYDFIYKELEEIKADLAGNNNSKTRANTFTALALQSRAMLYAGSLAKYNNLMATPIKTSGGEVGIPASRADDFYQKSLKASREIINSGKYALYDVNPNKGENFYEMLMKKDNNQEIIFAKDYVLKLKAHAFTHEAIVRSLKDDNENSSSISPSLSLVESYDYLDGSNGTLKYKDASGNYIVYDNISDVFANKDGRLYGTVIYPGTKFRNTPVSIQAGVAIWADGKYTFTTSSLGSEYKEDKELWTGFDGPKDSEQFVSNTGFYLRKFVSDAPQASARGVYADNWWPWFRLGEIYLNATEAAFELGEADALTYINTLRVRAGFPENSIKALTNDIIRKERRVELAFEDHRYYDLKRWRIAHEIWNGSDTNEDAVVYGLFPYRISRPGHADHNKFIYEKIRPTRFKQPRFFRLANYYSSIGSDVLSNNPKIIKNPYH